MATGSGKTKVMSLAVAWQYFNAVAEGARRFRQDISVDCAERNRVRTVADGFRGRAHFPRRSRSSRRTGNLSGDFQCYMRGEGERASSLGALYLTNIQQFYERPRQRRRRAGRDDGGAWAEAASANARRSRISTSASSTAAARSSFSTTKRTTPTTKTANGTRSFARLHAAVSGGVGGAVRFHGHAAPQQGATVFVDRIRLSAQAGHHRQRGEAAAEGHRQGNHGAAIGHRQHALSGVSGCRRRALEGVPRATERRSARSRCCS